MLFSGPPVLRSARVSLCDRLDVACNSLGLIVPPLSIVLQLASSISQGQMLTMLVASVCLFGIGRIVEGYVAASERLAARLARHCSQRAALPALGPRDLAFPAGTPFVYNWS